MSYIFIATFNYFKCYSNIVATVHLHAVYISVYIYRERVPLTIQWLIMSTYMYILVRNAKCETYIHSSKSIRIILK